VKEVLRPGDVLSYNQHCARGNNAVVLEVRTPKEIKSGMMPLVMSAGIFLPSEKKPNPIVDARIARTGHMDSKGIVHPIDGIMEWNFIRDFDLRPGIFSDPRPMTDPKRLLAKACSQAKRHTEENEAIVHKEIFGEGSGAAGEEEGN